MIVRLSQPAEAEFASAVAYVRGESPQAATALRLAIEKTIDSLATLPNRGRIGSLPGTREIVVRGAPYIVAYTATDDEVVVYRSRHTSQDPSPE